MLVLKETVIGDRKVAYYRNNLNEAGAAVVYLHGWGSEAMHFKSILEHCDNFVAVDLPGFGKSERPKTAWNLDDYADFLDELFEKLKIKNAIIVGHSFGGSIAIKYVSKYQNARKLVLIDSAGIRRKYTVRKKTYYILTKIFGAIFSLPILNMFKQHVRKNFYKAIDSEDYLNAREMTAIYKKIINQDISADLQKIKLPTILIWGENDKDTPVSDAKIMNELLTNSRLCIISGAGHFPFLDNKPEFEKIFFEAIK